MSESELTLASFAGKEDSDFRFFVREDQPVIMKLKAAEKVDCGPGVESFRLVFLGSADHIWPQRIYRVEHEELGSLDIFIVPIERNAEGSHYEACFNHLRREG